VVNIAGIKIVKSTDEFESVTPAVAYIGINNVIRNIVTVVTVIVRVMTYSENIIIGGNNHVCNDISRSNVKRILVHARSRSLGRPGFAARQHRTKQRPQLLGLVPCELILLVDHTLYHALYAR
jgi:hypothetical protein